MRLTFRAKLMAIVGISAFAFVFLIGVGIFQTKLLVDQLAKIQGHYIPLIELGPQLEADFEHLRREFQDSVSAQDFDALKKTELLKSTFLSDIDAGSSVIESGQTNLLHKGVEEYYSLAYEVSHRLISRETGMALVNKMTRMQGKHAEVAALLEKATVLDRGKLTEAFSTVAQAQAASGRIQVFTSVFCLILVFMLSLALGRSVVLSLVTLSKGFARFGQGDFSLPIDTSTNDELADVARDANQMAARIMELMKELDSFSSSVAHDLRAPLRGILGFSNILKDDFDAILPAEAKECVEVIIKDVNKMGQLIDSLLKLSRLARKEIKKEPVNLSAMVQSTIDDLQRADPDRKVSIDVQKDVMVKGDAQLMQIIMTNLLGNAWKYSSKKPDARIEFGMSLQKGGKACFIRDNGAGFDMQYVGKLFGTFQRLHSDEEFEGTGIGLAMVQNIIHRHGGTIWAESVLNQGATFYFIL